MNCRIFIKFGQESHIEDFQKNGSVYCNPIKYFLDLEDQYVRGDTFESVVELKYLQEGILELKPNNDHKAAWKKINVQRVSKRKQYSNPLGNLFCMSAIKMTPKNVPFTYILDERLSSFGSSFLVIYNVPIFLKRLKEGLDKLQCMYKYKFVEYLDLHTYTGPKDIFQKDLFYSYQEEFRVYIDHNKIEPLKFSIGCIEDISQIYKFSEVSQFLIKLGM